MEIFQDFKANFQNFELNLLLDEEKFEVAIGNFLVTRRREEFKSLSAKVDVWFPSCFQFNKNFLNYLWTNRVDFLVFQLLGSSKEIFKVKSVDYLNFYRRDFQEDFEFEIYERIERDLVQFDAKSSDEYLSEFERNRVEKRFVSTMIYDNKQCRKFVTEELKKIYQGCLAKVKSKVETIKKLANITDCASKEICNQKSVHSDKSLLDSLQPYLDTADLFMRPERFLKNKNIKHEVDETIYETIGKLLRTNGRFESVKSICIVEYSKRKNLVDEFYTPALLFDEVKLSQRLDGIVDEYERLHGVKSLKFSGK
jgi:hypothetical protein